MARLAFATTESLAPGSRVVSSRSHCCRLEPTRSPTRLARTVSSGSGPSGSGPSGSRPSRSSATGSGPSQFGPFGFGPCGLGSPRTTRSISATSSAAVAVTTRSLKLNACQKSGCRPRVLSLLVLHVLEDRP